MPPVRHPVVACLLLATLASCAGPADTPNELSASGARAKAIFAPEQNGLEVRQWRIDASNDRLPVVLSARAEGEAADEATLQRLERNGFRLVRTAEADLPGIEAELESPGSMEGWHGQIYEWRELLGAALPPGDTSLAFEGRVRTVDGGRLVLAMRAWTMPMETGPVLQLELRPVHVPPRRGGIAALRGDAPRGVRLDDLYVELPLEPGYAYILTAEAPGTRWPMDGPVRPAAGRPRGPGGVGPAVDVPLTLGQRLLEREQDPPRRECVVFLPRIPAALDPASASADAGSEEATP